MPHRKDAVADSVGKQVLILAGVRCQLSLREKVQVAITIATAHLFGESEIEDTLKAINNHLIHLKERNP